MLSPFAIIQSGAKHPKLAPLTVSSAKHLRFLVENKQMQILRSG